MKKPLNILITLGVLAVLVVGAYVLAPQWFPPSSDSQNTDQVVASGSLTMTEITETRHADVEGANGCDVRVLYPQIAEESESIISQDVRESMNLAIQKQVQDFLSPTASSIPETATAFAMSCQSDLADAISFAYDTKDDSFLSLQDAWVSEIGYDMKLNDGKYLSLGIANYLSTGGAHPNTTELFMTFDIATGKMLTLRDLVLADQILSFVTQEKQQLVDEQAESLFEESLQEYKDFLAAPTQEAAEKYCDDAVFYLADGEYVTFYNPYVIAPYVVGPVEARLPR